MKKNRLLFLIAGFLPLVFLLSAKADVLTLDPNHTYVLWHVSHFGFSTQSGKWYASGTLDITKDHPEAAKLNAVIKLNTLVTGNAELDKHLNGKLFFDTAQFPTATFVSKRVVVTGSNSATVDGMLTLHGITKPISLAVKLNQSGVSPITDKMTAGFTATTTIKRSDFGIKTLLPGLGDEVKLDIEAEAYKP